MQHVRLILIVTVVALSACKGEQGNGNRAPVVANGADPSANSAQPVENAAAPAPAPAKARKIADKSDTFEFSYRWPTEAAAIPALDAWFAANAQSIRASNERDARTDARAAKKDGYVFNPHSYEEAYATVGETSRLLVLVSEGYVYTGGAHGMPINTGVIWDKVGGKRISTWALFDKTALVRLLTPSFCAELDRQRGEKRGGPVNHDDPDEISEFVNCVGFGDRLILPVGSGDRHRLDTVRIFVSPYEAGPYAEGTYVIDLPITKAIMAAVSPQWRDAFSPR